jgi:hypothetical protein
MKSKAAFWRREWQQGVDPRRSLTGGLKSNLVMPWAWVD